MAGHWYDIFGNPQYEIEKKAGGLRPTTLADAKKYKLVPSVTTILSSLDKPALHMWKTAQLLDAVLHELPSEEEINNEEDTIKWKKKVINLSSNIARQASDRGNIIHNKFESYYNTYVIDSVDKDYLTPVIDEIKKRFPDHSMIPEASFFHALGFGGKIDLHSKDGEGVIIDFKTKLKDNLDNVKGYHEQGMQLAAYRIGLGLPKARCINIFLSSTTPGVFKFAEWEECAIIKYEEMFKLITKFWQLYNDYRVEF
jgi:hypothetical protein